MLSVTTRLPESRLTATFLSPGMLNDQYGVKHTSEVWLVTMIGVVESTLCVPAVNLHL